jgi:hypothetical protein
MGSGDNILVSALGQRADDGRSDHATMAGDKNAFLQIGFSVRHDG